MYHNWSASEENMLLGVPKVIGWLVWMGLMSAFQLWCKILEKLILSLFVGIFAGVNECSFPKFVSFWVGFLAFLWPKVMKNHGVPKIRVFLGQIFGISLAQSDEESWRSQNSCLSGSDFWHFSGPK